MGEKSNVFRICTAAKVFQDTLLGLRRPENPKAFTRSSYRRIEDAMRDVVFICVGDYDFNGVILKALRLMNRHGIRNLKWNRGIQRVVVLIASIVFVDREAHGRIPNPFEIISVDIELAKWSVEFDVELDSAGDALDANDKAFQVVINNRAKTLSLIKQNGVTDFVRGYSPSDR